jgi:RNA-directed DNA polymerase
MTTAQAVGAVSREAAEWYAIDWRAINRNVRRLQVRIVQATKASRWGRVRALQRLLTHSYSGKVLAVRRVTENDGKKTPGVDQEIWDTPEKKTQAVHALKRRGYQSQPLRRVYIPKSDGKTMRPLGIPTMKDRAQQALYLLALAPVVETTADKNSYGFRAARNHTRWRDRRNERGSRRRRGHIEVHGVGCKIRNIRRSLPGLHEHFGRDGFVQ